MLVIMISDIQIQITIKFGTVKSINWYLKAKNSPHTTRILKFEYVFNDFVAPNHEVVYI